MRQATGREPQRTYAEEFRHLYGYDWPYEHVPARGPLPEPAPDDISELWYKVKKYAEQMGEDQTAFLARLYEAEETLREAEDYVAAFEPEVDYDDYMAEIEAKYEWEED